MLAHTRGAPNCQGVRRSRQGVLRERQAAQDASQVTSQVIKLTDNTVANTGLAKLGLEGQSEEISATSGGVNVKSVSGATSALGAIDEAIETVSGFRASFGAVENRIDAKINNLTTLKVNTQAAQSRIEDADFAAETTNMTKAQILSQAATSMLAQANASKQNLLALLQG